MRILMLKLLDKKEIFNPVEISIDLNTGFELSSLKSAFHEVDIDKKSDSHHRISLPGPISSDRDFVLRWEAKDKDTQTSLFKEEQGGYDHLLLTLNPPLTNKNIHTLLKERLSLFKIHQDQWEVNLSGNLNLDWRWQSND